MPDRYTQLAHLIAGHLRQALTVEEQAALDAWLAERSENREFLEKLDDMRHLQQKVQAFHEVDRERLWALTLAKLADGGVEIPQRPIRRVRWWLPYAAALLLGVVAAAWFFLDEQLNQQPGIVNQQVTDISPGGNRATLTLPDGRMIPLDEARRGIVIGPDDITYNDGNPLAEVDSDSAGGEEITLLELTTPMGGTYQVTLPDGTDVWLNAATTLKYPPRFSEGDRIVELIGEAYFSVAKDAEKPFKVVSGGQEVQVLGTEFNVSAYPDDPETKTTLVDGRVSVSHHMDLSSSAVIQPGQQSILRGTKIDVEVVNVEQYTAWKDGIFYFKKTPFNEMILQVARWYDVEVIYEGGVPQETFTGKMQRELTLATMLELLDISDAEIRLDSRRLIIQ